MLTLAIHAPFMMLLAYEHETCMGLRVSSLVTMMQPSTLNACLEIQSTLAQRCSYCVGSKAKRLVRILHNFEVDAWNKMHVGYWIQVEWDIGRLK